MLLRLWQPGWSPRRAGGGARRARSLWSAHADRRGLLLRALLLLPGIAAAAKLVATDALRIHRLAAVFLGSYVAHGLRELPAMTTRILYQEVALAVLVLDRLFQDAPVTGADAGVLVVQILNAYLMTWVTRPPCGGCCSPRTSATIMPRRRAWQRRRRAWHSGVGTATGCRELNGSGHPWRVRQPGGGDRPGGRG